MELIQEKMEESSLKKASNNIKKENMENKFVVKRARLKRRVEKEHLKLQ